MLDNARYCARCGDALSRERIDGRDRPRCGACAWIWWDHARPVVLVLAVTPTGKVVLTRDSRFPPGRSGPRSRRRCSTGNTSPTSPAADAAVTAYAGYYNYHRLHCEIGWRTLPSASRARRSPTVASSTSRPSPGVAELLSDLPAAA